MVVRSITAVCPTWKYSQLKIVGGLGVSRTTGRSRVATATTERKGIGRRARWTASNTNAAKLVKLPKTVGGRAVNRKTGAVAGVRRTRFKSVYRPVLAAICSSVVRRAFPSMETGN